MFSFSGIDGGGVGSAKMDIVGSGTSTFTVTLDNTSPILATNGVSNNAPGITGFGFNVDPVAGLSSWSLTAKTNSGLVTTIGGSTPGGIHDWKMNTSVANVDLDYLPTTATGNGNGVNIKGALYNPLATAGLAALPNYFTTAVLTLNFDVATTLDLDPKSTFVRMQNVGNNGSLKLWGVLDPPSPPPAPPAAVPEPGTLVIFFGLISCVIPGWRRRKLAV